MKTTIANAVSQNRRYPSAPESMAPREKLGGKARRGSNRSRAPHDVLFRQVDGQRFRIREDVFVIGRNYECDLRIEKPHVSPVHAVIFREDGGLFLEDLGGGSGTLVNRVPVSRKALSDGDRISIGWEELVFKSVY